MFITILILSFMLVSVVTWHYWALLSLKRLMPPTDTSHLHFPRVVLILVLLVSIHLIEILWFSGGIFLVREVLEIGDFTKPFDGSFQDYLYYSFASYTTLGKSEFSPLDNMKLFTGFEALIGFVMLTWSATFFYSISHRD